MNREIRAAHNAGTIFVYQAYPPEIADAARKARRLVPPFKRDRMTWIKPSFLWLAYRSGWATKPGQERILAIELKRSGFDWALAHSSLSHFEPGTYADHDEWLAAKESSPVRIQWDPERDYRLRPLDYRAIQIGLSGEAVDRFVDEWFVALGDFTKRMHELHALVQAGDIEGAHELYPREQRERPYPVSPEIAARIGMTR